MTRVAAIRVMMGSAPVATVKRLSVPRKEPITEVVIAEKAISTAKEIIPYLSGESLVGWVSMEYD